MLLINGYDCTIKLSSGLIVFCITSVKKYYYKSLLILLIAQNTPTLAVTDPPTLTTDQESQQPPTRQNLPRNRQLPARYQEINITDIYLTRKEDKHIALALKLQQEEIFWSANSLFINTHRKEINSLIDQQVFQIVDIKDIPQGKHLFSSRFVDKIKRQNSVLYKKSRLIIQAYYNSNKKEVLT